MQSENKNRNSQPIGTIWCAVCELAKGGMFNVEHAGTSTDQKLHQTWNCSSIKVTCKVSIFQQGNSIVQLKQFNCSIEDKSGYSKRGHKRILQK